MGNPGIDQKIAVLQKKLEEAKEQKKALDAKRRAIQKATERKLDTRKKILIGASVMASVKAGMLKEDVVKKMLDMFLEKKEDRELFGLKPKNSKS